MSPPRPTPKLRLPWWSPQFPFDPKRVPFFYGWVVVAAATLGIGASIPAQTMGIGVFTDSLMEALSLGRVDISLAYLVGTLASAFLIPRGGSALDRAGARRFAVLSAAAMGVSLMLLAQCDWLATRVAPRYPALAWLSAFVPVTLAFFLVRFWGQGMLTIASRNMIGKWFHHRRGLAVGISGIATALLFSAAPAILDFWIQRFGWRGTLFGLGCLLLVGISLLAWLFFRDNPEECGLTMDGDFIPSARSRDNPDLAVHRDLTRDEALRTYSFWIFNLSLGWHSLFGTAYAFHVVSIGDSIGMDRPEILRLFLYASVVAIASNLACGWISSRTRVKYLLILMNLTSLLFAVGPLLGDPVSIKTALVVGMGISGGLWSNLSGQVFARFFGRAHLGAISGVFMSTTVFGSAAGPYFFGVLHAAKGDYRLAFALSAIVPALLALAALRADNPQRTLAPKSEEES